MARRTHRRRRYHRNPPFAAAARRMFGGMDPTTIGTIVAGLVGTKLAYKYGAPLISKLPLPRPAVEAIIAIAGGFAVGHFASKKIGNGLMTGGLAAAAVSLLNTATDGTLGEIGLGAYVDQLTDEVRPALNGMGDDMGDDTGMQSLAFKPAFA